MRTIWFLSQGFSSLKMNGYFYILMTLITKPLSGLLCANPSARLARLGAPSTNHLTLSTRHKTIHPSQTLMLWWAKFYLCAGLSIGCIEWKTSLMFKQDMLSQLKALLNKAESGWIIYANLGDYRHTDKPCMYPETGKCWRYSIHPARVRSHRTSRATTEQTDIQGV